MSQISPPIRIVLIGAVVLVAAWFTILKPKPVTAEPVAAAPATATTTAAKPQTAYGKAVAKAKSVAAAAASTATPTPEAGAAATPAPAAAETPAQPPIAIPDADLAKLPQGVADALKARKILVLGVFADGAKAIRPQADDDRYVRTQLRKLNRYDGDVFVQQIAISELSTYGSLVNDLGVHQSPSVVIIDRDLKGRVLTGYVDRYAINQVIADIRRESTEPRITDTYLRDLNAYCGDRKLRLSRLSYPTSSGQAAWLATSDDVLAATRTSERELAKTVAPAKWRTLKTQLLVVAKRDLAAATKLRASVKQHNRGAARKALTTLRADKASAADARFNRVGLTNCAVNRQS